MAAFGRGHFVAERFEIVGIAGAGGMGTVYRAHDRHSGALVALKIAPPHESRRADRWSREAMVLAELDHPGLPRYVGHGTLATGDRWIAMEWLEGEDLQQRLSFGRMSLADSLTVVARTAAALAVAHAAGIVHRDIKPSNLFLPGGQVDRVKVLDFGVARWRRGGKDHTRAGTRVGTPRYMAPEQARGAKDVDGRVDIFALGCVLYTCLTGRHAFPGDDEMAVLAKVLLEEAPVPSELVHGLSPEIDALVARMLAKDPQGRPRDCTALAEEILALGVDARGTPPGLRLLPRDASGLGGGEQRLLSVVLVRGGGLTSHSDNTPHVREATGGVDVDETHPARPPTTPIELWTTTVAQFGGKLEALADGSMVVSLSGIGAASDQAAQAARLALALRAIFPDAITALATGRGVVGHDSPMGEAIDRAARLLRSEALSSPAGAARPIRLDEVTAGLLDGRFEVAAVGEERVLTAERAIVEAPRTLLGNPTPLVGRDLEMAMLKGVYAECVSEQVARAVVVTAEPGIGKSRLRHELVGWLAGADRPEGPDGDDRPPEIWQAAGDHLRAGSPFGLVAAALRRAAGILDGEPPSVRQRKLGSWVAGRVLSGESQRVAEFVGELVGVPFPDEDRVQLAAARQDPILMSDQIRRAFEDLVAAETALHPLLIVVDDLHWGDLPTVKLLDAGLRAAHDRPFMVLALARPEIAELFPRLWEGRRVTRLALGELSRRACQRLVARVLGAAATAELVERVVSRAAGNAFFLEELIRAVADKRGGGELPPTILAMMQARLEELAPEARRVLRAASVLGDVFWRGAVLALLGDDACADEVDGWLEHLVAHEVVGRRPDSKLTGQAELTFRHALVREAAYSTLTEADRELGHRLAARWLRSVGEADPLVVAEHLERGGARGEAVEPFLAAAQDALEANDLGAAIARAGRGIACGANGERLGRLRLVEAEAASWRGELNDAEHSAELALKTLPRHSPLWYAAAGELAGLAGRLGHHERLEELGRALLGDLLRRRTPARSCVVAAARCGVGLLFTGRYALGGELLERIDGVAAELAARDPAIAAVLHRARAIRALSLGDQAAGLLHWPAAVRSHEEAGDLRGACQARGNLANRFKVLGGYGQAEALLREVMPAATRLGVWTVVAQAKQNLGVVRAHQGSLADALAIEREAVRDFVAQGDRRLEGSSRTYVARILLLAGDAAAAETEALEAAERTRTTHPAHALALATLAEARLRLGDRDAALADAREAKRLLDGLGGLDEGDSIVHLAHARVLAAAGLDEEAADAAAQAKARLIAAAEKIGDPMWRKSFLENVPENRETLALEG